MPIYSYKCEKCGKSFDFLQKISEEPKKVCPECNQESLVKQLSASNFTLKGSCYKNGYGSK